MKPPRSPERNSGRHPSKLWMAVVCLHLLLTGRVLALDPSKHLTEYNCQTWSRQNGLMINGVNAIAQTEDGYMWLGTSSGLVRFDGTGFTTLHPPKSGNNFVTSLAAARGGGLWVGLENNAVYFYDGAGWPTNRTAPTVRVEETGRMLKEDSDGTLLIASANELARLTPAGRYEKVVSLADEDNTNIMCGYHDSQGRFWYGTAGQGASYWQGGTLHWLADPEMAGQFINALAEDSEGSLWVGAGNGLFCYDASLHRKSTPVFTEEVKALLVDRQGVLWIGTARRGLVRYYKGQYEFFQKSDGLASNAVRSLTEDREGSLWVGEGDGVSVLTDVKFPTRAASETPAVAPVSVCASRLGGIWIANNQGLTYRDDEPKNYGLEAGLTNIFFKRVLETRNGDLYLINGVYNELLVLSHEKIVARYAATNMLVGLAEDDQGVVVSGGGGLYRVGTNYFTPYLFTNDLAPQFYFILNLTSGRDGAVWVSSVNGIFRVKNGTYQQWTTAEGLPSNRIISVCEESNGVVWAATPAGIARLEPGQAGRPIKCISENDGLFDNDVYAIVPDDLGNLWVDAGRGMFRVSRQSLDDFADGRTKRVECRAYDGLESVKPSDKTFQERVGCKSLDGRIWFPNPNGVVMINPRKIPTNLVIPPVHIQTVRANGREYPPGGAIVVPPGNGELALEYVALSFIAPQKTPYRYRLEGYDPDWVDAASRRLAYYTNLKPGRYTFHVIAANADGIWNQTGDSLAIELRPHYYQTAWFYGVCGVLLLTGLAGGYGGFVRGMRHKAERLQEARDRLEREVNLRTQELSYERDLLRGLLDCAPDQIYFKDVRSRFIRSSKSMAEKTGLKDPGAMVGKTDFDFFAEEHARPAYEDEQQIIRTGQPLTGKVEREVWKNGRESWALTSKMPLRDKTGQIIGTLGISKDITTLKQTETELAYQRDLLRALMENSPDHIYFKDRESRFLKCCNAHAKKFGLSSAEMMVGKTDADYYTAEHARPAFEDEQEIIRTGQPMTGKLEKETWPDGHVTWALTNKMALRNQDGQIIGTFGVSKDITALKRTEAELAYERDLLRSLLDNSPDSIYFKDRELRWVRVSRSEVKHLQQVALSRHQSLQPGEPAEDLPPHLASVERFAEYLIGKSDANIYGPKQAEEFSQDEREIMRTGRPLIGKTEQTTGPDGNVVWYMTTKVPWRNPQGEIIGTFGASRDISALKQAEAKAEQIHKQLLETSRQAGMAEVATNVLHNVGNVLNSVNVSASVVLDNTKKSQLPFLAKAAALLEEHAGAPGEFLTKDSRGRELPAFLTRLAGQLAREQAHTISELELLRQHIEHIKEVVAMQQSYAKISGVVETIQMADLVEDALRMNIGALDRHHIQLVRDYHDLPPIMAEKHKIIQILVNLIRNAKYACDESGRTDKKITLQLAPLDEGVRIAVIDNGVGMPPEIQARLFDHGFTTRKGGHGFGLHSGALTARELGGSLSGSSAGRGQGATFALLLPLHPPKTET